MEKINKNILINSTLAFISAFIATTIFHEFGHYLSYVLFGADPTLFHNYVQTPDQPLSLNTGIVSALAGPFFSLVQGLILWFIVVKNKRNTTSHLLFLWLSLLGFINFFGYLVMTPFTTVGDTGKVAELLNIGYPIRFIISIIGLVALIWVIYRVAINFANFIPNQTDKKLRAKYVYQLMFFPIIIGSLVNALLAFPIVAILSVIYPATSPYVIMSSFPAILKASSHNANKPEFENQIMKLLVFLTISAIAINRLLTLGIG